MSKNLAAVIPTAKGQLEVVERSVPKPAADEVVVKNHVVAVNPVDWKIQSYAFAVKEYPTVLGSDTAGEVVAVGSDVKLFKPGDRVTGFSTALMSNNADHGVFQTYTAVRSAGLAKLPDNISDKQAAVLPMQVATAGDALFDVLGLPRIAANAAPRKEGLLIWGGAASVGLGALQMAKALGFTTYVTASAHNHAYLRGLGADHVFDYKDAGVADAIVAAALKNGQSVRYGFDAVGAGKPSSAVISANILAQLAGGQPAKLALALPWPADEATPDGVEAAVVGAVRLLTTHGDIGAWLFNDWLPQALADGSFKPEPSFQREGSSLQDVQHALDVLKAGVSAKKVIVTLA